MRYTFLELSKCKRLMLNNITLFRISFTEMIQLILGTNGSGKSSIIDQLTPLPPEASAFNKDGHKIIKIEDRGHSYVLKTTFSPSTKHSFKKNDEELNPSGTASVQRELVQQEFRITPEIHDLLRGEEKFTQMLFTRRREWFTRLADTNYDYVLSVYMKLTVRERDLVGAMKETKRNLVAETNKAITAIEEEKLRRDVESATTQLNYLLEYRKPLDNPVSHYTDRQQQLMKEIEHLGKYLLNMKFQSPFISNPSFPSIRHDLIDPPATQYTSLKHIDTDLDHYRHNITAKEAVIGQLANQHEDLQKSQYILTQAGDQGIVYLTDKITQLRQSQVNLLRQRVLNIEGCDPTHAMHTFEAMYETLFELFSNLPENNERYFSQSNLDKIIAEQLAEKNKIIPLQRTLDKLEAKKLHFEEHRNQSELSCPICAHKWIPGFSEENYAEALVVIEKISNEIATLLKAIEQHEKDIASIREYGVQYRIFSQSVKNGVALSPFWNYIIETNYLFTAPRKILPILEQFKCDLECEIGAEAIEQEITKTRELIHAAAQVGDVKLMDVNLKLNICTTEIDNHTRALNELKKNLDKLQIYRNRVSEAIDLGSKLQVLITNAENTTADVVEAMRRETLNHCIAQLQHSLAIKQESLSAALLQKGIIAGLEKQLKDLTEREEAVRLMVRALSPKEGIIAEGLFGFIRTFTTQMNAFIRKIWSYPLLVHPTGVSDAYGIELDYKFPLMIQTKENVVSDVSKGSDGIREIINLAFKMIACRYLALDVGPLTLDEVGRTLDKEHQVAMDAAIKTIMETANYSQLFMISHHANSYGAFTNAEVCVLDARNIITPAVYNKHVTFE